MGFKVGIIDGDDDGTTVGLRVGTMVGIIDGDNDGTIVGLEVDGNDDDGISVGLKVGIIDGNDNKLVGSSVGIVDEVSNCNRLGDNIVWLVAVVFDRYVSEFVALGVALLEIYNDDGFVRLVNVEEQSKDIRNIMETNIHENNLNIYEYVNIIKFSNHIEHGSLIWK